MESTIAIFLIAVALATVAKIAIDVKQNRTELVSLRNFFLVGFILFQCTSAAVPLWTKYYPRYTLDDASQTALRYGAMVTVTVLVFFLVYDHGPWVTKLSKRLPRVGRTPNIWKLMALGACCLLLATVFRFTLQIPLWGILANFAGISMAAVAAGIAGWVWAPRLLNPAVAIVAAGIILGAMAITIAGTFGRRGLVSVAACVGWGMYYSHFRHMSKARYLPYLFGVATAGVLFLAVFTSIRGQGHSKNFTPMQFFQLMVSGGNVKQGLFLLAGGQETGHVSMWLLEYFPDRKAHEDFLTLRYIFLIPVPRSMWEEKPWPLSIRIPEHANLRRVPIGQLTIGPGLIGTAWADGGWFAVFLYPALFAGMFKLLDQWTRDNAGNLFVVMPIGAAIGQVIAIPRGEVSLFTFIYLFSLISTWAIMLMFAKLLRFEQAVAAEAANLPVHHQARAALPAHQPEQHRSEHAEYDEVAAHDEDAGAGGDDWAAVQEDWPMPEPAPASERLDWAELAGADQDDASPDTMS